MELSVAEFARFSTNAKAQILGYKAIQLSCISMDKVEVRLYAMNGSYYVAHVNPKTSKTVKVEAVLNEDWLYMFAKDIDVSTLFLN